MSRPVFVELHTTDPAASIEFYAGLFGWEPAPDPEHASGGYTPLTLGGKTVSAIGPAYVAGQQPQWVVSFATDDAAASAKAVAELGGRTLLGPQRVFDLGTFVFVADPLGATFTLWQPDAFPGFGVWGRPGSMGWAELSTPDPDRVIGFYADALGWSVDRDPHYAHVGLGGEHFGGIARGEGGWKPYFEVAELDATAAAAVGRGAETLVEPVAVGEARRVAVLRDPQGAVFGLFGK
ncbi:VOC family protein [Segniliparus rugosus]|uniref:VOC family protein n=1 Tax=Segniliparus rugosus TaxID=286804 RepID=UPI0001F036FF|nr:VOC family protein [Segniliparus rugosus]